MGAPATAPYLGFDGVCYATACLPINRSHRPPAAPGTGQTASAVSVTLSRRQVKNADRVGGIELLLPWPPALGAPPAHLARDEEREATEAERTWATEHVAATCSANKLMPVHVRVACVRRPPGLDGAGSDWVHLSVTIIGFRWVHAKGRPRPLTMFANVP